MAGENLTDLESYRGKLTPIPEYHPTTSVILSAAQEYVNFDLVKKFKASGVSSLFFIIPTNASHASATYKNIVDQLQKEKLSQEIKITPMPMIPAGADSEEVGAWARDFGPLIFRHKGTHKNIILDFKYSDTGPRENDFNIDFSKKYSMPIVSIPLKFEGGNFMAVELNDKMYCLTTSSLFVDNKENKKFSRDKIIDLFENVMGCDKLLAFPWMPYEGTTHIDMWAKAVKKNVIFVADLSCSAQRYSNDPVRAKEIATYLNKNAQILTKYGFTVVRTPMPSPLFPVKGSPANKPIIRSYVNSLIVNNWVMVPRYLAPDRELQRSKIHHYPDASLIDGYEKDVLTKFFEAGLKPVWVDMDERCIYGGSIHCATMQIPKN